MRIEFAKKAEFVRHGLVSAFHLIWWAPKEGYFVTDPHGVDFNGTKRVPESMLP
ncbi:hypothetical protein [Synechococcus phage Ssp-JY38]|nr:hypothetical protein [Synechococcus phage Yong-L2-223]